MRVTFEYEWGSGPIFDGACKPVVTGSSLSFLGDGRFRIDFSAIPGGYSQSQATLACAYRTYIGDDTASIYFEVESSTDLLGTPVDDVPSCYTEYDAFNPAGIVTTHYYCGDSTED